MSDDLLTPAEADAIAEQYRKPSLGPPRTLEDYRRQPTAPDRRRRRLRADAPIEVVRAPSARDAELHRQRQPRVTPRMRHVEAVQAALGFRWDTSFVRALLSDARAQSRALRGLL